MACRRIADLDRPAYVKNSDLRYVSVNRAYARLFGREVSDFIGQRSSDVFSADGDGDCEDKERRALVFGTEETAVRFDEPGGQAFRFHIESFRPNDERGYIFAMMRDGAARAVDANALVDGMLPQPDQPSLPPAIPADFQRLLAETAFELMEVGFCIYDAGNVLVYANRPWRDFYAPIIRGDPVGLSLRSICEQVFDFYREHYPDQILNAKMDRKSWVDGRVEAYSLPEQDVMERRLNGQWIRSINRRLANGMLIGLRIDVTAMKQQELRLREHIDQTELYRAILEDLPVAAFVRDAGHKMVYANAAFGMMTGKDRDALLGQTEREMFELEGDVFFSQNQKVLTDGNVCEFEANFTDAQQNSHPIIARVNRVTTSENRTYAVGSMIDISALKIRETELVSAQQRAEVLHEDVQHILKSMPAGVMILDAEFCVEYANDAMYDIWNCPKDRPLEGKTFRDVVAKHKAAGGYVNDPRSAEDIYRERVATFQTAGEHGRWELNFDDEKTVILDLQRISGDRLLLVYADVSSVRRQELEIANAQQALAKLGELMNDTTHAMSQGVLISEADVILLRNDVLIEMLRLPPELLAVGQTWHASFDYCAARGDFGDDPQAQRLRFEQDTELRGQFSFVMHVAGERWMQVDGTLTEADRRVVVVTDITEMKEREAELQGLLARSEAADRAKSEFLANMSHEIRTPMNGVLGMAELLSKTKIDARQKTFVDVIFKSGNALLTIINDILDFSKIDAGQMGLRRVSFDPVDAVEDVATLLSSPAAEKNIELLVRTSPTMPRALLGDAGRFRQIVTNLIGNAVKFTERGHVFVDMTCHDIGGGETLLTVRVEDTGIGISKEKIESIFEKFSQVDTSMTRRHVGTGLGLAITAGLVDLFGGYIEAQSELGEGSVFTIHLPMPAAPSRTAAPLVPVNVQGARILVVDDNDGNRQILGEQLRSWGFDCAAAEDGETALAILQAATDEQIGVDAVILDYNMHSMTGADVARAIRGDSRYDQVALIFLTSMDMAGGGREFDGLNGQAHLLKPVRGNILRSTIIDVIRAARQPQPAKPISDAVAPDAVTAKPNAADLVDILVAEDNEVNRIVFTQILQGTGLRFVVVQDGKEAVEAWRKLQPRLIMMDVSMPVMNGHEATRAIRGREAEADDGRHVPIIAVTAHALDADRDMCLAAGMDDYMSKPISPELLEGKIRRWLGEDAARSASGR